MKILIAEDSRTQAARLAADLRSQDFEVVVASNGKEALDLAAREGPDLILSDVLMPELDGFRLCRQVRLHPQLHSIPIVLRTAAFLDEEDRAFASSLGATAYIPKQVDGEELGTLLQEIGRRQESSTMPAGVEDPDFHGTYEVRLLHRLVQEAAEAERVSDDLRQTQQLLLGVMDNSPAVVSVVDVNGSYLMVNKQFERLFNVDKDEVIGKRGSEIFGPAEEAQVFESNFKKVVAADEPLEFEERVGHADGIHTYLSTKFPLRDAEGKVEAVCSVSLDITERLLLEERARRSQKMEAVGRLAGGIAHDFNNMLGIIISYATFASENSDDQEQRAEDLEQVIDAAKHGADLTRQLLTFSRGREVATEIVDINDLVDGMVDLLRASAGEKVNFRTALASDECFVEINPEQLGQILLNLVVNGRDAMAHGGDIKLETSQINLKRPLQTFDGELAAGRYVRLSVSDTGSGIPDDTLQQIFDPFFTTKEHGTGLGLSTVHGIVKAAGGSIAVASRRNRGTTFQIYLPFADAAAADENLAGEQDSHEKAGTLALIVDDQPAMREVIRRVLTRNGYTVLAVDSGVKALHECERRGSQVGLVLTDMTMSGMTGTELGKRLATTRPDLPVIYMSGSTETATREMEPIPEGAPFMQKPFTSQELLSKVQGVLRSPARGSSARDSD